MKHRIAAVSVATLLALAGCGGNDVSTEEARAIVVNGLIEAGLPPDVARCSADAALEAHSPGELVNTSGRTTDEVNASVAAIVADCTDDLAPPPTVPATTVPATTVPPTTAPATAPAEVFEPAVCAASGDVLVVVAAARELDDPGPAAYEGWVNAALDRTELAVVTAPPGELRDLHLSLHSAVEEFQEIAVASGYDSDATAASSQAQSIADEITALADDVRALVGPGCADLDADDSTAATALAAQLMALDDVAPATTAPTTVPVADVRVDHLATNILLDVPAAWVGEHAGVADTKFGPATRFLVRAPDPAVFDEGRFDGTGVSINARDDTVDFNAMLAVSGPAQSCTLAGETSYDDGVYVGVRREYTDCAGTPVAIVVVGAADDDAQVATVVEVRAAALDDRAIDVVLNSFYV